MRKVSYIFIGIILFCLSACNGDIQTDILIPNEINAVTFSRNTQSPESLAEGDSILFSARGRLIADKKVLTYTENQWVSTPPLQWNSTTGNTTYTALYPVYENKVYTTQNLYGENGLEDILIAQDTLTSQQSIEFIFKHLFSQLTIHVNPSIQAKLQNISLISPYTVTDIASDGTISVDATPYTTTLSKTESGSYSFLLPPMKDCQLTVVLTTDDKTYTNQLPANTFESHVKYECKVRTSAGIRSVEDLIAFSQLINGKPYAGKTLADFGEKVGEDSVFYLLDNIELTPTDCEDLLPIGYSETKGFKHIFEGNNYTISGLIVPDRSDHSIIGSECGGLFGWITEDGLIKNLHIANATSVNAPTCKRISILSGTNKGIIINCSVTNSSLYSQNTTSQQGYISAYNTGTIANCYTTNCEMTVNGSSGMAGGITGFATGHILNCYAYHNSYPTLKSSSFTGGIVGQSHSSITLAISNCCVYHDTEYSKDVFGGIIGYGRAATTIYYCFYNNGNPFREKETGCDESIRKKYYKNYCTIDSIPISTYLNEWIEQEEANPSYPNLKFKKWTTDTTILPIFQ